MSIEDRLRRVEAAKYRTAGALFLLVLDPAQ